MFRLQRAELLYLHAFHHHRHLQAGASIWGKRRPLIVQMGLSGALVCPTAGIVSSSSVAATKVLN